MSKGLTFTQSWHWLQVRWSPAFTCSFCSISIVLKIKAYGGVDVFRSSLWDARHVPPYVSSVLWCLSQERPTEALEKLCIRWHTHMHTPITLRHYLNQRLGFPMILCQCCLKEARERNGHPFQPDLCKEKNKHCKLPMGKQESTTIC